LQIDPSRKCTLALPSVTKTKSALSGWVNLQYSRHFSSYASFIHGSRTHIANLEHAQAYLIGHNAKENEYFTKSGIKHAQMIDNFLMITHLSRQHTLSFVRSRVPCDSLSRSLLISDDLLQRAKVRTRRPSYCRADLLAGAAAST